VRSVVDVPDAAALLLFVEFARAEACRHPDIAMTDRRVRRAALIVSNTTKKKQLLCGSRKQFVREAGKTGFLHFVEKSTIDAPL
jgi:hypothetical protein